MFALPDYILRQLNFVTHIAAFEQEDTSTLKKDDQMSVEDAKKLFSLDHLLVDGRANQELRNHLEKVGVNEMGRFIAENFEEVG